MDGTNGRERGERGGGGEWNLRAMAAGVLRTPLSLAIWGGAGLLWLTLDQGAVGFWSSGAEALGAGLVVQATLVAVALRDPDYLHHATRAYRRGEARRRLVAVREDPGRFDAVTRQRIEEILRAYEAVCREASAPDMPRYARGPLQTMVAQMGRLAEQAAHLAGRRMEMVAHLEGVRPSDLRGQQASLRARSARSDDAVLKMQLEQSLRFKTEEIGAYEAIRRAIERSDGQLESVECGFAALRARVLRLKTDDKTVWSQAGEQFRDEIRALSTQMDVLDRSVGEVLALRGGAGQLSPP